MNVEKILAIEEITFSLTGPSFLKRNLNLNWLKLQSAIAKS